MSEASPRPVLRLVAILWVIALLLLIFVYYQFNFTQYMDTVPKEADNNFVLSSSAFNDGESIPPQYTCDEKQISPPLSIGGAPEGTKSYALIMEDRDVPRNLKPDGVFLHWVVFNISAETAQIGMGERVGMEGASGNGVAGYVGPCPPPQYDPAEHRYYFDLYALDTVLNLSPGADVSALRATMDGHVLAQTTLVGRYARREK